VIGSHGSPARRPLARGDIVLVPFPFTDLTATKRRPAVVLWADLDQVDFALAFISSRNVPAASSAEVVLLPTHPEFGLTGLAVPSRIRGTKLVTLTRSLITRWLGRLGPLLTAELDRALVVALGINTIPYRDEGRQEERRRLAALHGAGGAASLLADLGLPLP
jgi:mRNA interferase MazF